MIKVNSDFKALQAANLYDFLNEAGYMITMELCLLAISKSYSFTDKISIPMFLEPVDLI